MRASVRVRVSACLAPVFFNLRTHSPLTLELIVTLGCGARSIQQIANGVVEVLGGLQQLAAALGIRLMVQGREEGLG